MAAKVEASSAFRGIGLVKLMGRQSGFIAMQVTQIAQALLRRGRYTRILRLAHALAFAGTCVCIERGHGQCTLGTQRRG